MHNNLSGIQRFSKSLYLDKSGFTVGVSLVAECSFWQTKYQNIYLTDYNLFWDEFSGGIEKANLLKYKNAVMLFYKRKGVFLYQIISFDLLGDKEFMLKTIDDFKDETEIHN